MSCPRGEMLETRKVVGVKDKNIAIRRLLFRGVLQIARKRIGFWKMATEKSRSAGKNALMRKKAAKCEFIVTIVSYEAEEDSRIIILIYYSRSVG